jgi:hypothetical protein
MYSTTQSRSVPLNTSKAQVTIGRILSGLASAMFLMDGISKLFKPAAVIQGTLQLGYPESQIVGIGILLLVCTAFYIIPRTAVFGAILLTGYLGGAVASQVRIAAVPFNISFPLVIATILWAGIYLREPRLREVIPFRS